MPVTVGEGDAREKEDGCDGRFAGELVGSHEAPSGGELVDPLGWDRVGLDEFFDGLGCFFRILIIVECDEVGSGGVLVAYVLLVDILTLAVVMEDAGLQW